MSRLGLAGALLTSLSLLSGCGGSGGIGEDETATHVRVLNMIGDSPSMQFVLDTTVVATAGLGSGSAYSAAPAGSHSLQLKAVRAGRLPGATGSTDPINVGAALTRTFDDDHDFTVIAAGTMATPQTFIVESGNERNEVAATKFIWRMAHAVAGAPSVDVYITAPEAGIAAPQYVATLAFQASTDSRELTLVRQTGEPTTNPLFVNLTIELRQTGTATVLFNSGAMRFNERNRIFFAIAPNAGAPNGRPFQLATLATDSSGGLIRDAVDPSTMRLVNLSHNSPALDMVRLGTPQQTLATNIAFGGVSTPRAVTANGSLDILARATADPSNIVFVSQFTALRDQAYSIFAIGPVSALDDLVLSDDRRSVPTQTRFRYVHAAGSLSADTLDAFLTLPGKAIDFNPDDDSDTTDNAANLRQVSAMGYRAGSGYISLEGGTYDVYFTRAGATTILLGPVPVTLNNGEVKTFAIVDSPTATLQLQQISDIQN